MRCALLILTLIATIGTAEGKRAPTTTWGKLGVSFVEYRQDARECALRGATANIRDWQPTKGVMAGTLRQDIELDRSGDANEYSMIYRRSIRPNVAVVQQTMVGVVEECLIGRGYREIVLDRAQERRLRKLKWGTEARARYLHSLNGR